MPEPVKVEQCDREAAMMTELEPGQVEAVARAIHDGPLGAGDYEFDGSTPNEQKCSEWCREVARVAIDVLNRSPDTDGLVKALRKAAMDICGSPLEEAAPINLLLSQAADALSRFHRSEG